METRFTKRGKERTNEDRQINSISGWILWDNRPNGKIRMNEKYPKMMLENILADHLGQ